MWNMLSRIPEIVGKFADYLLEEKRRKAGNQDKHAIELKNLVLQPILTQMSQYYPSACSGRSPLLSIGNETHFEESKTVTEHGRGRTFYKLESCNPQHELYAQDFLRRSPYAPGVDAKLYRDCLTIHYPEALSKYEDFLREFGAISGTCAKLVDAESLRLSETCDLPQSLASDSYGTQSVNYLRIALYAINRLMGKSFNPIQLRADRPSECTLRIDSEEVAACGSKEKLEKLIFEIDKGLGFNKTAAEDLSLRLTTLGERISPIVDQLELHIKSYKKLESCPFVS